MTKYCTKCHKPVSNKWHEQYRFCSEYCRKSFIKEYSKNDKKVPKEFGDTKARRNYRKKQSEEMNRRMKEYEERKRLQKS